MIFLFFRILKSKQLKNYKKIKPLNFCIFFYYKTIYSNLKVQKHCKMQGAFVSLLYSTSQKPLEYFSKQKSRTGLVRRILDEDLSENVLELQDAEEANCQKTWIMTPPEIHQVLSISLPIIVIVLKSTNAPCYIQILVEDKDNVKHLINLSNNKQKKNTNEKNAPPRVNLMLEPGWNRLEIDLGHLTKIFETQFKALCRLKICANCRIRRIYCLDKHYEDDNMSLELYQGFLDNYMLKWGITAVDRMTQTKKTTAKPSKTKETFHPANGFNKLFLKNLQAKSDKLIENFFSKQSVKSIKDYLNFKQKAKIKPYVIPDHHKTYHKNIKNTDSDSIDLNEFKKTFLNENYLYGKLAYEDNKNDMKEKAREYKNSRPNSVYKIHKYKYLPNLTMRKMSAGNNYGPMK